MTIDNRFFIINADDHNITDIISVIVGDIETQRYNNDLTYLVVKLHKGDASDYPFMSQYDEYDHVQILEELNNSEWQSF